MNQAEKKCYEAGVKSKKQGWPITANPHKPYNERPQYYWWCAGWNDEDMIRTSKK